MDTDLKDFFKKEYEILCQAHFQAAQRITNFFQYTLVILAAPLTAVGFLKSFDTASLSPSALAWICAVISVVGFALTLYLCQLRTEMLMYARCVNSIRNYFFNQGSISNAQIFEMFTMPTQKYKPKYFDGEQQLFIILSLAIVDASYLFFASNTLLPKYKYAICIAFFISHFLAYKRLTIVSERNSRFYKRAIGVDIDGVLNLHEAQFVKIYNLLIDDGKICASKIQLSDIKTLPVHKYGQIKRSDEVKVFNTAEYWTDMPPMESAANSLSKIKNAGYKIHIFTQRSCWNPHDLKGELYDLSLGTTFWLDSNNIPFDYFNYDASAQNRLQTSIKKKIQFFVEDNPENARKLAHICRYVFLIDHPYNQNSSDAPLPYNVLRVKDWLEIETTLLNL